MKYKAKALRNGTFAVGANRKQHFLPTYATMAEAELNACLMSAHWYRAKADECRETWEKLREAGAKDDDERKALYFSAESDWSDSMA